jgi:hypothetical protein
MQERRWRHVWRWLLRRLRSRSNTNTRPTVGQCHQLLLADDLLDLLQALFIKRQNRISDQLFLLQFPNHVAIVARRKLALLGDLRRDGLHFLLDLDKALVCQCRHLLWRNIDTVVLECEGVLFGQQPEIFPCLGQHGGAHPRVVVGEL